MQTEKSPSYDQVSQAASEQGLVIYGALRPNLHPAQGLSHGTLVLLGTGEAFWPVFTSSREHLDAVADPIDQWSARVIGDLAETLGAKPYFPFGGPPYTPFVDWALATGRAFTSPSQMMVHDEVGMLISYRGALHFDQSFDIPPPPLAHSPCATCTTQPCLNTCPVHALADGGPYDLTACHQHLDTPAGVACMTQGCLARCACPLSQGAGRRIEQTAHHMRYFHPS
ncbi:ferredoxin [Phaeobacter sp. 11ANDIMAR09]|uniref:ferredoxin n=1 Tax=Phaeobacter sp. 11ANDIMAR09 TaxID=1225647 RepID=UPI0009FB041B|nr:ferredoxin [Phaeobacter sp. 11ANDIMAR09]